MKHNDKECTLTDSELTEKVDMWVTDLTHSGGEKWCLRVPADHNHDPDFLFIEAARRMNRYASRISELEAEKDKIEIKLLDAYDRLSKLGDAEQWAKAVEAENKRLMEALIDAKEDAAALIEQHRWIPVTERLPEENIYVLALAKARSIQEPGYNMQVIHSSAIAFGLFSHWQPLPQPPKEQ